MKKNDILKMFKNTKALLEGHFLLSSGLHSKNYLQCALLLQNPKIAQALCKELSTKFAKLNPTVVVGPALGGVIVAYETARALGVKGIFTERVDGVMCLRRGFELTKQDRVIIVEDVITTGKSTKEVVEIVKTYGAKIVGIGCIADRSNGKSSLKPAPKGLLKIEIPTFKQDKCPLCKKNISLVKPGSRNISVK